MEEFPKIVEIHTDLISESQDLRDHFLNLIEELERMGCLVIKTFNP